MKKYIINQINWINCIKIFGYSKLNWIILTLGVEISAFLYANFKFPEILSIAGKDQICERKRRDLINQQIKEGFLT